MEQELTPEQIEAEEKRLRDEVRGEVWGSDDEQQEPAQEPAEPAQQPEPAQDEPQESEAVRKLREAAAAAEERAAELESALRERDKRDKAEKEEMQKRLEALEKPAEPVRLEAWEALKSEYAPVAQAIEQYLEHTLKSKKSEAGELARLVEKLQALEERKAISPQEFNESMMEIRHPKWRDTINTKSFQTWYASQPTKIKKLGESSKWEDGSEVLSTYAMDMQAARDAAEAAERTQEDRAERLRGSVTPIGKGGAQKSGPGGQTEEQIRAEVRKKVWG